MDLNPLKNNKMKKIKSFIYILSISALAACASLQASEKIYIDSQELDMAHDKFHIHLGHNVWIETNSVSRDDTGLYTLEGNILNNRNHSHRAEQQRTWKCPYCYYYWPIGTPCGNSSCPSRYK